MQNFVFAVKFDNAAQHHWVSAALLSMMLDLIAFALIRITVIWIFPRSVYAIAFVGLLATSAGGISQFRYVYDRMFTA